MSPPGVASAHAARGKPRAFQSPIAPQCLDCIGGAGRRIAAGWRKNERRPPLPGLRDQDESAGDHAASPPPPVRPAPVEAGLFLDRSPGAGRPDVEFGILRSALRNSSRSSEKSRSTPPARPINIWSEPSNPPSGSSSRASARKRRFMRLRTTAPPIFLVTVMPMRMAGSPSSRARTSRTKPGMGARLP